MTDYDDTLTDPNDVEVCDEHRYPVPCEVCWRRTEDEQADWKEDR